MHSRNTGLLTVQVFNADGLQFQSEVPQDFSGFFGNAGREASMRRFFFHFESREHLTCVLFILFGGGQSKGAVYQIKLQS